LKKIINITLAIMGARPIAKIPLITWVL